MVIQRRRTLTGFGGVGCTSGPNIAPLESTNQISSSEDSNDGDNRSGLWEKQSCTESHGLLKSLNDRLTKSQGGEKGVSGSFDLLRVNLQAAFDAEIASVVSKYREKFFNQAYKNLKSNLGEHAVSESDLLLVIQKMVQQSALQFSTPPSTSPSPPSKLLFSSAPTTSCNPGPLFEMSDSDGSLDTIPTSLPMFNTTFQKYSWRSSSCTTPGEQVVGQKRKKPLQGEGQSGGMAKKPENVV